MAINNVAPDFEGDDLKRNPSVPVPDTSTYAPIPNSLIFSMPEGNAVIVTLDRIVVVGVDTVMIFKTGVGWLISKFGGKKSLNNMNKPVAMAIAMINPPMIYLGNFLVFIIND